MGKRNPNHYGSVTRLKGNRLKPWIVRVTLYDEEGRAKQTPIGYAETEEKANILLAQYNNNPWNIEREKVTLAVLYQRWLEIKAPKLGAANQRSLKSAYKHCSELYGMKYRSIKAYHMQRCIDNSNLGSSSQVNIKNLFWHLDRFAFEMEIIDRMYSQLLTVAPKTEETSRSPFTAQQIDAVWKLYKDNTPWADTVLLYLYTGFRVTELLDLKNTDVNLLAGTLKGGIKSEAGKGRMIPIHSRIMPIVEQWYNPDNIYLIHDDGIHMTKERYYKYWRNIMKLIGICKTPHEARHTFETALDNAGGNRKCIDMLMGHSSKDIGNRVYNHKTLEQLKETIKLLK